MVSFEELKIGEKVRTNKDYSRWCGCAPVEGVVVGKEVLPDQKELEEKYPLLYAHTNPYVILVQTPAGEIKRLNIVWLDRVR